MSTPQFRIWFGSTAATALQLRRIEQIEVTQEMDAIWEARIEMVLALDARGQWLDWPGDSREPFSRVRVEVDPGNGSFAPLIDGPLVSIDAGLDALPGRSVATMVVRDDSAFLNRDEGTEPPFEHRSDGQIAQELFSRFSQLKSQDIRATQLTPETTTRRGTVLQFLRDLARANDRHAYVLPGAAPGASIGCFLPDPQGPAALPPLLMVGQSRNVAHARISQDPEGPERSQAQLLRLDDKGVTTFETSSTELGLMRELPARPADLTPRRLLHPADNLRADPSAAASGAARRGGYVYRLEGQTVPGRYPAVLVPYQKVRLDAGALPYSGDYLITQVVHRITPSLYTQHLSAKTDSVSAVPKTAPSAAGAGGLQASLSVGIF